MKLLHRIEGLTQYWTWPHHIHNTVGNSVGRMLTTVFDRSGLEGIVDLDVNEYDVNEVVRAVEIFRWGA